MSHADRITASREEPPKAPTVYLAGDTVFRKDRNAIFAEMKAICSKHGIEGLAPADGQKHLEGIPDPELTDIVQADFDLIDRCDGAVFCMNPVRRGTEMDTGTSIELGYAKAKGKVLSGWTTDARDYPTKVRDFFHNLFSLSLVERLEKAINGADSNKGFEDPDGISIHSHGMVQNGMSQGAIELAGGKVFAENTPDWRRPFEQAIINLKEQFIAKGKMPQRGDFGPAG